MLAELRRRRPIVALVCVGLAAIVVWQVPGALGGHSSSSPSEAAAIPAPSLEAVGDPTAAPTPLPTLEPTPAATPRPSATPVPARTNDPWQADPDLVRAKNEGRVVIDSGGGVGVLALAPPPSEYPQSAALDTSWSGLIQEPPRTGTDDHGAVYTDYNYALFCGAGTAAVVLYYWPAARTDVTTRAGTYTEPVDLGSNRKASTYWAAEDKGGYGRGMILFMAETEWPAPDRHVSWWSQPGLMNWTASPPSTNVENLVDTLNWEASGRSSLGYFYVIVPASHLTAAALLDHVHADISMGVPVVIAARTSDGTHALPHWSVKRTGSAVNHFITVVGYDDAAGTYRYMDTCGTTCNDENERGGVGEIGQADLYALILAESDNDGIMW
jgi:hypothetical protein